MKKYILIAFMALIGVTANAQSWIGGSLGFDYTKPEGSESVTTLSISTEYGHSFNDKWAIGIALEDKVSFVGKYDVNVLALEPFARFTFAKTGIVSFFVDGGFGFGCEYINYEGRELDDTSFSFSVGFKPGIKLSITDDISLVAKLGFFGYQRFEAPDNSTEAVSCDTFGLKLDGDALSFGINWNF